MTTARLPSLNGLRAFEAAARHGGFVGAADELNVTLKPKLQQHAKAEMVPAGEMFDYLR